MSRHASGSFAKMMQIVAGFVVFQKIVRDVLHVSLVMNVTKKRYVAGNTRLTNTAHAEVLVLVCGVVLTNNVLVKNVVDLKVDLKPV